MHFGNLVAWAYLVLMVIEVIDLGTKLIFRIVYHHWPFWRLPRLIYLLWAALAGYLFVWFLLEHPVSPYLSSGALVYFALSTTWAILFYRDYEKIPFEKLKPKHQLIVVEADN